MTHPYALHWFRRDLRVAGNEALHRLRKDYDGRVLGVFCFDKAFLSRDDFSVARFQYFLETLRALREEMLALGSDLLFLDVGPEEAFGALLKDLKKAKKPWPQSVGWNRDYEPFARVRDETMRLWFQNQGLHTLNERDHLLIEPHEIIKPTKPSEPYQIFTPFSKRWRECLRSEDVKARLDFQAKGLTYLRAYRRGNIPKLFDITWSELLGKHDSWSVFEDYAAKNRGRLTIELPEAGSLAALKRLEEFRKEIDRFALARDVPSLDATSRFSRFLKNGSLTIPQVISFYGLHEPRKLKGGEAKFLSELIWREFGYYILQKHPRVEKEAFDDRFQNILWTDNEDWFKAWKEGKTGFPIVDAGMRQLNTTGFMHNRVRMIVASFLTKDLHVNWQLGEKYFMDKLLDGDLALNNMGWQWAASTGCDAQPYFRIFNPALQQKKFDPEALYIKEFVPELRGLSAKDIHNLKDSNRPKSYPAPIVDHTEERFVALALYKAKARRS